MKKPNPIDVVAEWIEDKDASYLCKEDEVVWFASITGREMDKAWIGMTLSQVKRAISYTKSKVTEDNIISAFQELGRVYEMATHSKFNVPIGIFNYSTQTPVETSDKMIKALSLYLYAQKIRGILISDLNFCFDVMCKLTDLEITNQKRNLLYVHYFGKLGFGLRSGVNRVLYKGKKKTAMLHKDTTPSQIIQHSTGELRSIASIVVAKIED